MISSRRVLAVLLASVVLWLPAQALFAQATDVPYTQSAIAFNLRDISASGTFVDLSDDEVSAGVAMGFSFDFYGNTYSTAYISSNGFVTFDSGGSNGCCSGQPLPTPGSPDNLVAGYWEDLNVPQGNIRYQTLGTAPNRTFVVGYYNTGHFFSNTSATFEIILHETSNNVELQYGPTPADGLGSDSVGLESAAGLFGHQVAFGHVSFDDEGILLEPGGVAARATFMVNKFWSDDNPGGVEVTISCNTGLPLEQTKVITSEDYVKFVVTDFDDGQLDCEITEDVPAGYSASYNDGSVSSVNCSYDNVPHGGGYVCDITNTLQEVHFEVTKIWIDDHEEFNNSTYARARYTCYNVGGQLPKAPPVASPEELAKGLIEPPAGKPPVPGTISGHLHFHGEEDSDYFYVSPHWDGTTYCRVEERTYDSGVESDDSDCSNVPVILGDDDPGCTIVNTRYYEGIPTLSQYGLAVLALLMLGMGLVGFRRFI